jgi:hypothetical protein
MIASKTKDFTMSKASRDFDRSESAVSIARRVKTICVVVLWDWSQSNIGLLGRPEVGTALMNCQQEWRDSVQKLRDAGREPGFRIVVTCVGFAEKAWVEFAKTPLEEIVVARPAADVCTTTHIAPALDLAAEVLAENASDRAMSFMVLASDCLPLDDWKLGLERLLSLPCMGSTHRVVFGAGQDADGELVEQFQTDRLWPSSRSAHQLDEMVDGIHTLTACLLRVLMQLSESVLDIDGKDIHDVV